MPLITSEYNQILCKISLGDYIGATGALDTHWAGPGNLPERDGHNPHEYAALVMLSGILTVEQGLMGGRLQEQGKDMLSMSVRLFEGHVDGVQTAKAWLATAYERCGDYNEALALADDLLASRDSNLDVTIIAAKTKSIALDRLGFSKRSLEALEDVAGVVEGVGPLLQGKIALQRGMVLRRLGQADEAIQSYDLAIEKFYDAKSPRYEASAANNMAGIYMDQEDYLRAHILTEKAIRLFHEIGDEVHEGAVWDQSAQISRKEGKLCEAEKAARKAVSILENTDQLSYLAEAYTTLGSVLVDIGTGAAVPLEKAASIYRETGNTVLLDSVNGLLWESVLRIKKMAESHSAAIYEALRPIERQVIERVLDKHNWRVSPAAKELKLTHKGLSDKLKKHFPDLYAKCPQAVPRLKSIIRERQ